MEDGGDAGGDVDRLLVVRSAEVSQRVLGLGQIVDRLSEVEFGAGRAAGGGRDGTAHLDDGLIAHPRPDAHLVVKGKFIEAGGDDVSVWHEVADVRSDRGARADDGGRSGSGSGSGGGSGGRGVFLGRDLLLSEEFVLVALVFASGLVRVLGSPAAMALGELLLELARVEQHQRGQFDCAFGGVDGTVIALGHDVRNEAAVVQMGVGQDDRIEAGRVVGEGNAVAHLFVRPTLKHAAVDENLGPLGDEQVLGSGDGIGSAKEAYFHSRILTRRRFCCAPAAKGSGNFARAFGVLRASVGCDDRSVADTFARGCPSCG